MGFTLIIPAAGQGKRMGTNINKLFLKIAGETIIRRTISVFQNMESCNEIYVAAHPKEVDKMRNHLKDFSKVVDVIAGGEERQDSIYEVLKVMQDAEIIMVHDGARPLVTEEIVQRLYRQTLIHHAAVLAVPVKDTIKSVKEGIVQETYDRSTVWQVQTPQSFEKEILINSYKFAKRRYYIGTDDASLAEKYGYDVYITDGDYNNIKITTEEDIVIAEAILERRGKTQCLE